MALELWAGPECTVNRVGEAYHDQIEASGFSAERGDLDRLASLGVRAMRLPVIWERVEKSRGSLDWSWTDAAMARLGTLGIEPVAGLVHHGSGPPWTDLLDPAFPELLAQYALSVAARYPHVQAWTPVNEPLTTARFSGLYGHWYPHRADDASFVRALMNQVAGTVLAMRAVRKVTPDARLIQTEDLGYITSSAGLLYQAAFENARRWLTFDLLSGRVDEHHPLWAYLRKWGATAGELRMLQDEPCAPDILGVNSYLTSERHLDGRLHLHHPQGVGGNGRDRYADVAAVRVCGGFIGGFEARLRETCARYGRPVAITEVHLGCTRDEQLRWLSTAWQAAETVRAEGHDVRAVTCWAAFGAFDWDSLVTRRSGHYEPGLWDVRSEPPRPTALATLARQLAQGEAPHHPALQGPGWWQRDSRFEYPAQGAVAALPAAGRPLLITGATGTLGQAFSRICELRGLPCALLGRAEMDVADPVSVDAALERVQPWAVINAAGFVRVDAAEDEAAKQWRENVAGPEVLARACALHGIRLVGFSSDLVFDGAQQHPYIEGDIPRPLNAYGHAKHQAEQRMLAALPEALVVRTAAFFGPWDAHNFVTAGLRMLRLGDPWPAASDQLVSPTYVPDLVHASLDLLMDGESGLWHLANRGATSWARLAGMVAEAARLDTRLVLPVAGATLGQRAKRPPFSALASERGQLMPTLEDGLQRYLSDIVQAAGCAGLAMPQKEAA